MARDQDDSLPVEQWAQIDRLADQFEREFKAGNRPRIEDHLEQLPALRSHLLAELLAVGLEPLLGAGQQPNVEDYRLWFPNDRQIVEAAFADAQPTLDVTADFPIASEDEGEPTPLFSINETGLHADVKLSKLGLAACRRFRN